MTTRRRPPWGDSRESVLAWGEAMDDQKAPPGLRQGDALAILTAAGLAADERLTGLANALDEAIRDLADARDNEDGEDIASARDMQLACRYEFYEELFRTLDAAPGTHELGCLHREQPEIPEVMAHILQLERCLTLRIGPFDVYVHEVCLAYIELPCRIRQTLVHEGVRLIGEREGFTASENSDRNPAEIGADCDGLLSHHTIGVVCEPS